MRKYTSTERKLDLYDIGDGWTLMNIIIKNAEGHMTAIDTYIGRESEGYSCVGHTADLDKKEPAFSYADYVKMVEANVPQYLQIIKAHI